MKSFPGVISKELLHYVDPTPKDGIYNTTIIYVGVSDLLTLIWVGVGGNFTPPPSWFSLNNSKMVKALTLEFCNIQQHFIRDIRAKFGIHNSPQSPDIQNSDGSISGSRISGQPL